MDVLDSQAPITIGAYKEMQRGVIVLQQNIPRSSVVLVAP
jgi:hypothetical protein